MNSTKAITIHTAILENELFTAYLPLDMPDPLTIQKAIHLFPIDAIDSTCIKTRRVNINRDTTVIKKTLLAQHKKTIANVSFNAQQRIDLTVR